MKEKKKVDWLARVILLILILMASSVLVMALAAKDGITPELLPVYATDEDVFPEQGIGIDGASSNLEVSEVPEIDELIAVSQDCFDHDSYIGHVSGEVGMIVAYGELEDPQVVIRDNYLNEVHFCGGSSPYVWKVEMDEEYDQYVQGSHFAIWEGGAAEAKFTKLDGGRVLVQVRGTPDYHDFWVEVIFDQEQVGEIISLLGVEE